MDAIVEAIKAVADSALENDKALLNVIQSLIDKVGLLELRVGMLEDLHRLEEHRLEENG